MEEKKGMGKNLVEPKIFFAEWKNKMKEHFNMDENTFLQNYHDNTQWTNTVKNITESILDKKYISREYYRIDTLEYEYTDLYRQYDTKAHRKNFSKGSYLNVHNWINKIAIEYENSKTSWTDEMVKLANIRSKLKVIICYSEWKKSEDSYLKIIEEKMVFATELLNGINKELKNENIMNDKWLIIIGPCDKGEYDKDLINHFIGYEMNDGVFAKIHC